MDPMFRSLAALALAVSFAAFSTAKADTNVALSPTAGGSNGGVALFGFTSAINSSPGTAYDHSGSSTYLNDGVTNGGNGDDTWASGPVGYVGATFTLNPDTQVNSIVLYGRDFVDGGWFGTQGTGPAGPTVAGNPTLAASNLIAPTLQYTTNGGLTWVTDTSETNDYVTALTGAIANGGSPTNPATFTLTTALTGIDGIRLIGQEGGYAGDNGFLGADEIEVFAGTVPEPSTWTLMLGGTGLLAWLVRRRAVRV
jgi:hypothetical protein